MKKKLKRVSFGARPDIFYPNDTCSEYFLGEVEFVQKYIFTSAYKKRISQQAQRRAELLVDPSIPDELKLSPSLYFSKRIVERMVPVDYGFGFTGDVERHVIDAVREFGVDALRLNAHDCFRIHPLTPEEIKARNAETNKVGMELSEPKSKSFPDSPSGEKKQAGEPIIQIKRLTMRDWSNNHPDFAEDTSLEPDDQPVRRNPLDYLDPLARARDEAELTELRNREHLGGHVCMVLHFWRRKAQEGSLKERQQAIKHLKAFGKALLPETRGRRKNRRTAGVWEVKMFYLKELYRLYHIENAMRSRQLPRNKSLKVKQISQNFGMSAESVREFFGLDGNDDRVRRRVTAKDMARFNTVRRFDIGEGAVSNLLSS